MKRSLSTIFLSAALVFGACKKDKETSNRCPLPSSDWNYSGAVMFNGEKVNFSNLTVQLDTNNTTQTIGFGMFKNNGGDDIEFIVFPMTIGDTVLIGEGIGAVSAVFTQYTCTEVSNYNNNCVMWPTGISKGFAEKVNDQQYHITLTSDFKVDPIFPPKTACNVDGARYSEVTVDVDIVLVQPL